MKKVVSSNVDALGYCPTRKRLFVQFLSGAVYSYDGVAQQIYDSILKSPSVGSAVSGVVRGGYVTRKIEQGELEKELTVPEEVETVDDVNPKPFESIAEVVFSRVELSTAPKDMVSIFGNKVLKGDRVYPVIVLNKVVDVEGVKKHEYKMVAVKPEEVRVFDLSIVFDSVKYDDGGYLVPVVSLRKKDGCCGGTSTGCQCKGD
jgi:hypothetical protein